MQKNCVYLFLLLASCIFVVSHLQIKPAIHLHSSKRSDVILVKKKSLLKVLSNVKKDEMVAQCLRVQINQTRTLI